MSKHKWYNEIVAWAAGAEMEWRFNSTTHVGEWEDVLSENPMWHDPRTEYRIKPQPKEPQYLYVTDGAMGIQFWRNKQYQENPGQWNIGKIRLEQDNE